MQLFRREETPPNGVSNLKWWEGLSGQRIQRAMPDVAKLLVGPPLPDTSMVMTQSKKAGGWACCWLPHIVINYIAEKAQGNHFDGCKRGRPMREQDNEIWMNVGSWNVRKTLQACKMADTADELLKYDTDITTLQETRQKGYGRISKSRYILLYSGTDKQGEQGVGFLINH
jgi:hypothetical protein